MGAIRAFTNTLMSIGSTLILVVIVFAIGPTLEGKYFPVTKDVYVELVKTENGKMYFAAQGDKVRHCSLTEVRILVQEEGKKAKSKGSLYVIDDGIGPKVRALGHQDLGVWVIEPIGSALFVDASYNCHPLWRTEHRLGMWPHHDNTN